MLLTRLALRCSIAGAALVAGSLAVPGQAQAMAPDSRVTLRIPAQDLTGALRALARASGQQISFDSTRIGGRKAPALNGSYTVREAVEKLLAGMGLEASWSATDVLVIRAAAQKTNASANAGNAVTPTADDGGYRSEEIIVTAQKKLESIQDVPISVSAFSAKALDEQKIEGGSELLRAVPNVSFSKSNFATYNFSIRGVGTKALAVSTDPAVAISFNNTPLIRNRLFEQEYFDVQRIEVLRGPQGTLYGRNATGGVVNMIPNIAKPGDLSANLKLETGNYSAMRANGMINIPLGDTLAVRAAGAWTSRDGYDFNTYTGNRVNGRDLWSTRISAAWEPSDRFRVNAIWEHFYENDNRSRTGKQLCHRDDGPTSVGTADISGMINTRGALSQTCLPKSIYDDGAFGVPNGLSLPHIIAGWGMVLGQRAPGFGELPVQLFDDVDPYAGLVQSRNLREINTKFDPVFRAKNNVYQLNIDIDISENIKIQSQSSYSTDRYYSTQDYYRFVSNDVFNDSRGLYGFFGPNPSYDGMTPGGVFTDPQLGDSRKLIGLDMVRSKSDQYYQELRIQSDLDGRLNFNIGANYTKFKIDEDYFVFNNLFTALAHGQISQWGVGGIIGDCADIPDYVNCAYVDPNPIESIDGEGHNYFRSRNVSKTESYGLYGEIYYNAADNLKVTAGLRYTDDKKRATPYKSQLLLAPGLIGGGLVGRGYPASPDIVQQWGRMTGRFVVDWKPEVDFADDLLIYGSYARGYKGGGANPPSIGYNPASLQVFENPATFDPESLNAFEIGLKGAFADRKLTVSASAFYYDYSGYQVSQIVDRLALNENFDAEMWGADLEMLFRPTPRLQFNANVGYLKSRIRNGEESIDVMNRTQGNDDYVLVKPWMQLPSSCVVPKSVVETIINHPFYSDGVSSVYLSALCGGSYIGNFKPGGTFAKMLGVSYDMLNDGPNGGRGIMAPLGGNELPNAPRWTLSLGAQYTIPVNAWEATIRADYYRQGKSWARVYNTEIDRLRSWDNLNLSLYVSRPDDGLEFQFYVKNVFNKDSITDTFLNSDDSGLTANVFTVDPRIVGFSIKKSF